jgi:hypothetical protein
MSATEATPEEKAANRAAQREVESCLRTDTPHHRARWFVNGDGLYYGFLKEKRRGYMRGNYVEVARLEEVRPAVLKRIARVMNERDKPTGGVR